MIITRRVRMIRMRKLRMMMIWRRKVRRMMLKAVLARYGPVRMTVIKMMR